MAQLHGYPVGAVEVQYMYTLLFTFEAYFISKKKAAR